MPSLYCRSKIASLLCLLYCLSFVEGLTAMNLSCCDCCHLFFFLVYFGIMPPNSYTNLFWWVIATRNFWYSSLMFWVWGNQIKGVACCMHFSLLNNYRLLFCCYFIALSCKISLWGFCQQGKDMEPHVMSWKKNCSGSMKRLFHRIVDVLLKWFRQCS